MNAAPALDSVRSAGNCGPLGGAWVRTATGTTLAPCAVAAQLTAMIIADPAVSKHADAVALSPPRRT